MAVSPKSLPTKLPRLGCQGADSPEGEQRAASWGAWEVRRAQPHLSFLVNMTTAVR